MRNSYLAFKRTVAILVLILVFPLIAQADHHTVEVEIKGMVCAFCAQGITSSFEKHTSVANVDVEIEKHAVILELKQGASLSDEEIVKVVKDAGYDVGKIEREGIANTQSVTPSVD